MTYRNWWLSRVERWRRTCSRRRRIHASQHYMNIVVYTHTCLCTVSHLEFIIISSRSSSLDSIVVLLRGKYKDGSMKCIILFKSDCSCTMSLVHSIYMI